MNEKPLNLKKTTSSVLSVISINLCTNIYAAEKTKRKDLESLRPDIFVIFISVAYDDTRKVKIRKSCKSSSGDVNF